MQTHTHKHTAMRSVMREPSTVHHQDRVERTEGVKKERESDERWQGVRVEMKA